MTIYQVWECGGRFFYFDVQDHGHSHIFCADGHRLHDICWIAIYKVLGLFLLRESININSSFHPRTFFSSQIDEFKEFFKSVGFDKIHGQIIETSDEEFTDDVGADNEKNREEHKIQNKSAENYPAVRKKTKEKSEDANVKKEVIPGQKKDKIHTDSKTDEKIQQKKDSEKVNFM